MAIHGLLVPDHLWVITRVYVRIFRVGINSNSGSIRTVGSNYSVLRKLLRTGKRMGKLDSTWFSMIGFIIHTEYTPYHLHFFFPCFPAISGHMVFFSFSLDLFFFSCLAFVKNDFTEYFFMLLNDAILEYLIHGWRG